MNVYGRGFTLLSNEVTIPLSEQGPRLGQVSIGGRALNILSWSSTLIRAQLPLDVPTGERTLVVSRDHIHSPSFPIYVKGEGGARPSSPLDFSPFDRDSSFDDMSGDMEMSRDQMIGVALTVTLDDPSATVVLSAERREESGESELWVTLQAKETTSPLWGAASHLTYPSERLEFLGTAERSGTNLAAVTGEIEGRIFWYHGALDFNAMDSVHRLITLRFRLSAPRDLSPLRFTIPPRSASLRGLENQRLPGQWSGGIVTLGEVSP